MNIEYGDRYGHVTGLEIINNKVYKMISTSDIELQNTINEMDQSILIETFWKLLEKTSERLLPSLSNTIYSHYLEKYNSTFTDTDETIRLLFMDIPYDLYNNVLDNFGNSSTQTNINLLQSIVINMVQKFCESPLEYPHLLMNFENLIHHRVSNEITEESIQKMLITSIKRSPICEAITNMLLDWLRMDGDTEKMANILHDTFHHLYYFSIDNNRNDIVQYISSLDMDISSVFRSEKWTEYVRHLLYYDELQSKTQCFQCIRDHQKLWNVLNTNTVPLFSPFSLKKDRSHKNQILHNRNKEFLVKLNAINEIDAFSLEKIENIPFCFLYHIRSNTTVYVYDLVYLYQHISTSSKNPFTQEILSEEIIGDIRLRYVKLRKQLMYLKQCHCIKSL